MLHAGARRRGSSARASSASARTATTSRSAAAARSCGCWSANPALDVDWVVLQRRRRAGGRGARRRGGVPRRRRAANVARRAVPRRLLPLRRRRDQGVLRGARSASVAPDLSSRTTATTCTRTTGSCRELTWNTFRDHLILEYEIPKYDGDLGRPNVFVPLDRGARASARSTTIFDVLREPARQALVHARRRSCALLRLRGMECQARRAATPRRSTAASWCLREPSRARATRRAWSAADPRHPASRPRREFDRMAGKRAADHRRRRLPRLLPRAGGRSLERASLPRARPDRRRRCSTTTSAACPPGLTALRGATRA